MHLANSYFQLRPAATRGRVRVAWTAGAPGPLPGQDEERTLQFRGQEITPAQLGERFVQASADDALEAVGRSLWECLAGGAAGNAWRAAGEGAALRTVLDLSLAPEWQALPWEACWDGATYLTLIPTLPFVRMVRYAPRTPAAGWPRRVLIVCGEDPEKVDEKTKVREELEAIEDGLWEHRREIICKVVDRPSKTDLHNEIDQFQPHVLHFIGHGNGEGLFINNVREAWRLKAPLIRTWLARGGAPAPHLVFLNACRSAGGRDGEAITPSQYSSLVQAFLSNGVSAVVGMAGDVEGAAARTYATRFYREWLAGRPLDAALTAARAQVAEEQGEQPRQPLLAWLTVAREPEGWLGWNVPPGEAEAGPELPELRELEASFVDRNALRGELFDEWLQVPAGTYLEAPGGARILIVHGDQKSGKTDTVRLVLKAMLAQGWTARWQKMCDPDAIDWLGALRKLTDGQAKTGCGKLCAGLPAKHFADFQARTAGDAVNVNVAEDTQAAIRAWCEGLRQAAAEAPVALALDRISPGKPTELSGGTFALPEYLIQFAQGVLRPLCQAVGGPGSLGKARVLIILVLSSEEEKAYRELLEQIVETTITTVTVSVFDKRESKRALRQYFRKKVEKIAPRDLPEASRIKVGKLVEGHLQTYQDANLWEKLGVNDLVQSFSLLKSQLDLVRFFQI